MGISFLADYRYLGQSDIVSETDEDQKYNVEVVKSSGLTSENSSKLCVTEFDNSVELDTNGTNVRIFEMGPTIDKHINYRDYDDINPKNEPYLGTMRLAVQDDPTAGSKSRDEYWSMRHHSMSYALGYSSYYDYTQNLFSDGENLFRLAICSSGRTIPSYYIRISKRDEDTHVWTSYNVNSDTCMFYQYASGIYIDPCPCMVYIKDFGYLIFAFSLSSDYSIVGTSSKNNKQLISMFYSKDASVWSSYGVYELDPAFGRVLEPSTYPYAHKQSAMLKAMYAEGKIILGMMLQGTEDSGVHDPEYIRCCRIFNIIYSTDLGKTWSTNPKEFVTSTISGETPTYLDYLIGDPAGSQVYEAPVNFALGYDQKASKFIIGLRGTGIIQSSTVEPQSFDPVNHFHFFYNEKTDLKDWNSSVVNLDNIKMLDSFERDYLEENFDTYSYSGTSDWRINSETLLQVDDDTGSYSAFQAKGGHHLIYNKSNDPTMNRTIGISVDIQISDDETCGVCFCREDEDNFYAVSIYGRNIGAAASADYIQTQLKRVLAGTETALISTTNFNYSYKEQAATSDLEQNPWMNVKIFFTGYNYIVYYINDVYIGAQTDNSFRSGKITLFTNGNANTRFKNLGLLTSTGWKNIPGYMKETNPAVSYPRIGNNIDFVTDHFGKVWLAADVTSINVIDDGSSNFYDYGIVLQNFRLEKDIVRVEGKFLAEDKYLVKFLNNQNFQKQCGYYFDLANYSILKTSDLNSNTIRPMLNGFVWHKGEPIIAIRRKLNGTTEKFALVHRDNKTSTLSGAGNEIAPYSDQNFFTNFQGFYHDMSNTYAVTDSGYTESSLSGAALTDGIRVSSGYFEQSYNFSTGAANANAKYSTPFRYFDTQKRGVCVHILTKSYSSNSLSASRDILELELPRIGVGTDFYRCRLRVDFIDETTGGAKDGQIKIYDYDYSSAWSVIGTATGVDTKTDFIELMLTVCPVDIDGTYPKLFAAYRYEGDEKWNLITSDRTIYEDNHSTPASIVAFARIGAQNKVGATSLQEFKSIAFSDTNFFKTLQYMIRGETVQGSVPIHIPGKMKISLTGGLTKKFSDVWNISDVKRRSNEAENILLDSNYVWKSDDVSADKSIIVDMGQNIFFDTVALYGTNAQSIKIDYSLTNSFPTANVLTKDLTYFSQLEYTKSSGINHVVSISDLEPFDNSPYPVRKDSLVGYRFISGGTNPYAFRIIGNTDYPVSPMYIYYEANHAGELATETDYLDIYSDRIAVRYTSVKQARYFKLTFVSPNIRCTPEDFFTLKQFAVGISDVYTHNPEYPEVLKRVQHVKQTNFSNGNRSVKTFGGLTLLRTLNFKAVSIRRGEFVDNLIQMFRRAEGVRPVFYIPDIAEKTGTGHTYTFDLMCSILPPSITKTHQKGDLTDITLQLKEKI